MKKEKKLPRAGRGRVQAVLVYLAVTGLVVGCYLFCMAWVWPRYLQYGAPTIAAWVPEELRGLLPTGVFREGMTAAERVAVYAARDAAWKLCLTVLQGAGLLWMLGCALGWRSRVQRRCASAASGCERAALAAKRTMACIALGEMALAALTWALGVRDVVGRTVWDYLSAFGTYALCALGGAALVRLGAPGCLSARHGWFRRL